MSARATLEPLPSCAGLIRSDLRELPTPPFCWCPSHRLLCTPWETGSDLRQLTRDQESVVSVVAQAALRLPGKARVNDTSFTSARLRDGEVRVHWIASGGERIGSTVVDEAWLRNRIRWFVTLQIERTQP